MHSEGYAARPRSRPVPAWRDLPGTGQGSTTMEFQVQYRDGRRWVVLASHPTRNAARDDAAARIAFLVADGFKYGDVVRDFRVRGVTVAEAA